MKTNIDIEKRTEKILKTKLNRRLLFEKFCYYIKQGKSNSFIYEELKLNYRTVEKWKIKMDFIEKINKVKIDRALREMIFTTKKEIELFNLLVTGLNFWCSYEEITKEYNINISRYFFKRVKQYIMEEIN